MPRNPLITKLRGLATFFKYACVISFGFFVIASFKQGALPESNTIQSSLFQDPVQTRQSIAPFVFEYRGRKYRVEPVAEYDIRGVVVSHNDISAWWDMYHTSDSVDLKDLCLVWGDNLKGNLYKKVKFHNESVSCHWQIDDGDTYDEFRNDQVSNNHLLSDSEVVRQKIREARVGDQIAMSGWLVNYSPVDEPEYRRTSSLVRTDLEGFACEVMFVKDYRILRKANRFWFSTTQLMKSVAFTCLVLFLLSAVTIPYLEYRYE